MALTERRKMLFRNIRVRATEIEWLKKEKLGNEALWETLKRIREERQVNQLKKEGKL
jgi:hypothetical protein